MTTKKTMSLEELREQAAATREAWTKIPPSEILRAIQSDLQEPSVAELAQSLRPLFEALPADDPTKQHVGSLIGLLTSLPAVITQRLEQLK